MRYTLWIDDIRNPRDTRPVDTTMRVSQGDVLLWARDVEQAMFYVELYGAPIFVYLDHDLGEVDVMMFLKWLSMKYEESPPDYAIISMNPEGAKSIQAFMETWKKSVLDGDSSRP